MSRSDAERSHGTGQEGDVITGDRTLHSAHLVNGSLHYRKCPDMGRSLRISKATGTRTPNSLRKPRLPLLWTAIRISAH
jgi:hypothetical protein